MVNLCDGTKAKGTRNCGEMARWLVKVSGDTSGYSAACDTHLSQVGTTLLEGEQGKLEVHHIFTRER